MARPNLLSPGLIEKDQFGNLCLSKPLADYLRTLEDTASASGVAASLAAMQAEIDALDIPAFNINGTPNQITTLGDLSTGLAISIATTYPGQTSITTVGTITVGEWNGTVIGPIYGGTGLSSYAAGDLLYASATNVLGKLAAGTNGYALRMVAGVPAWAAVVAETVTNGVTGIAPSQGAVYDAIAAAVAAIPAGVPLVLTADYSVVSNTQVLFSETIEIGTFNLDIAGSLIEVA